MPHPVTPLLEVRDLGVVFPVGGGWRPKKLHALAGVSFAVDRGEILAVVGESGSGKSTIGRAVTRLVEPTSGSVLLEGVDVHAAEPRGPSRSYRRRVQMIFQDPFGSLNPVHTAGHHVIRPLRIHGKSSKETARRDAAALLDLVGLRPGADFLDKHPFALSGGQRQRVAIARALATEPDILVADEPTSMLDVSIRMDVLRLLDRLRRERNLAVLLITHDLAAARYLSDRILVMYGGQLMEEVPSKELAGTARHPYTKLLVAAAPRPNADIHAALPARSGLPQNIEPLPGCPFIERCYDGAAICSQPLTVSQLGPNHRLRCHIHGDPR